MDRTYQSIKEKSRTSITCKMIDKHFPTRYNNSARWNVCLFLFREIKYDEHKVKSCYLLRLSEEDRNKQHETDDSNSI